MRVKMAECCSGGVRSPHGGSGTSALSRVGNGWDDSHLSTVHFRIVFIVSRFTATQGTMPQYLDFSTKCFETLPHWVWRRRGRRCPPLQTRACPRALASRASFKFIGALHCPQEGLPGHPAIFLLCVVTRGFRSNQVGRGTFPSHLSACASPTVTGNSPDASRLLTQLFSCRSRDAKSESDLPEVTFIEKV